MTILIGYKNGKSKAGKNYTIAQVLRDSTPVEQSYGTVGQVCDNVWLPEHQVGLLLPAMIGKEVELDYEVLGGRPYLTNFAIVGK